MKLTNCITREEKSLKNIDLESLNTKQLTRLSQHVKGSYEDGVLEDENIVIDALTQVAEELGRRV